LLSLDWSSIPQKHTHPPTGSNHTKPAPETGIHFPSASLEKIFSTPFRQPKFDEFLSNLRKIGALTGSGIAL
jgi:hypothetical protein